MDAPGKESPSEAPSTTYQVYRVEYLGEPNHEAIFVETKWDNEGGGELYHVIGNILQGMEYEMRKTKQPQESATFAGSYYLGTVAEAEMDKLRLICGSHPPPPKQLTLSGKPIDADQPIRRCGEWAADVISDLRKQRVLLSGASSEE